MSSTPPSAPEPSYQPPASGYASAPSEYGQGTKPKGTRTLGLIAFVAAAVGLVLGSILGYVGGQQLGSLAQYSASVDSSGQVDTSALPPEAGSVAVGAFAMIAFAFVAWGVFALWGLIQGIVAAVKNRGRGWAIAAIIVAVLGAGAVTVFLTIGTGVGTAAYL